MDDGAGSPSDLLLAATRALRRRWARALAPWQLSPHQARALRAISASDPLRPSELATMLRIAPRSATEVVDALAERGAVERVPDEADRRAVQLRLTDDGHRLHTEIEAARARQSEDFLGPLDEGQRRTLAMLLAQLVEH